MKVLLRGGWRWMAAVAMVGVLVAGAGGVQAGTIYVSTSGNDANDGLSWATAKRTVQAGLQAASLQLDFPPVWVAAGTYVEKITLKKNIALYGGFAGTETDLSQRDWIANVTILDGNQAGSVVTAATSNTRIDGFVIRNGFNLSGGGICCGSSSPTITNNTITGNRASEGGGIYCGSSATITNNTITGNRASEGGGIYCHSSATITNNTITDNFTDYGGGVYCHSFSPTVTNNTITDNRAYYGGGGIFCYSSATITNNTITGNSADWYGHWYGGGGICCISSSPTITNNTITGNSTSSYGGGINCDDDSSSTIANNTLTGNSARYGGGIYCSSYSFSSTIANNTIMGNGANSGGGIYCSSSSTIINTIIALNSSGIYNSGGTPTVRYCCVYGNTAYNFSGMADLTGTNGNISADPKFVSASPGLDGIWATTDDTLADLRLLPGSSCLDAGSNSDVPADVGDLDGDGDTAEPMPIDLGGAPRFADDPYAADTGNGTAPLVDIGAYEHRCGDANGDGLVDVVDLLGVVYAFGTLQGEAAYDATCDFNADGTVDVIDLLDIVYNFGQ